MTDKLIIVESPAKANTIKKFLGGNTKVVASMGHIRDLPKSKLGINIENNFEPEYINIRGKGDLIKELKTDAKNAKKVYLATDPDREGEAISWHLKDALGIKDKDYERVLFHEITHDKVIDAFKEPRKIDDDLVKSQETRRILDRIIGFRLSKLMQSKTGGKSAGRVQSVALKLIVDREREIKAFVPEEYWTITSIFDDFNADLFEYKNKKIESHFKKNTYFLYLIISFAFFLMIVVLRMQDHFEYIIVNMLHRNMTFTGRTYFWDLSIEYIKENIFIGTGYWNMTKRLACQGIYHAHSTYLSILLESGIVGFVSYYIILIKNGFNINKIKLNKVKKIITFAFFSYFIMTVSEVYIFPHLFYLLMLLADSYSFKEGEQNENIDS